MTTKYTDDHRAEKTPAADAATEVAWVAHADARAAVDAVYAAARAELAELEGGK